jgi:hypothetical protein
MMGDYIGIGDFVYEKTPRMMRPGSRVTTSMMPRAPGNGATMARRRGPAGHARPPAAAGRLAIISSTVLGQRRIAHGDRADAGGPARRRAKN